MSAPSGRTSALAELRYRAGGVLGAALLSALAATTRLRRIGDEHHLRLRREGEAVIFIFWHTHLLSLVHAHRGEGIVTLVSEHADGEYLARAVGHMGYGAVRGSSTRGGTRVLRALIREAAAGKDLALAPDGPRGPAGVFKPGALLVAQRTGLPVVPMAAAASRGWRLGSWDGMLVPRPLSTICITYGLPCYVPAAAGREERAEIAAELTERMNTLALSAAREVGS